MSTDTNIRFCQYLLVGARAEAKRLGVEVPKRLTALRSTRTQFFVEGNGIKGKYVEADNAYDARAKFIYALCNRQREYNPEEIAVEPS